MDVVCSWLEARSRWSMLRELGQSNLVKASVLMPVFGYLLLLNENVHAYLTIQFDTNWPFNLVPSMWRIWMLFYGSFFVAMASILFSWQCPVEIKQYATPYSLVDSERSHITAQGLTGQIAQKIKVLYGRLSRWEYKIFGLPRLDPDHPNLGAGTLPDVPAGDQWGLGLIHIWTVNNLKHPKLRICVHLLFWCGMVLLAFPAAITFMQVTMVLGNKLLVRFL